MVNRFVSLSLAILVLAVFASLPILAADDKPHEGTVVKAGAGKLTMASKGDKKHTHDVARDAKIALDDKKANLEDLKDGQHVKVWMDDKHVLTKIEAHSKK